MTDALSAEARAEILAVATRALESEGCTGFFMSSNTANGRLSMHNGDLSGMAADLKEARLYRKREAFNLKEPDR